MSPATPSDTLSVTQRTKHVRLREQGSLQRGDLRDVLDAGFICHLGVEVGGSIMVVPTVYGADDDALYIHGSVASRSLIDSPKQTVCVTITHVDGLVLARSVFEHGVNYRSAMIYGVPRQLTDTEEKLHGLKILTEHAAPGQWDYARAPSKKELAATSLLAISLDEASVKIRAGGPDDGDSADAALDVWAGVLPIHTTFGDAIPDQHLRPGIRFPEHIASRQSKVLEAALR